MGARPRHGHARGRHAGGLQRLHPGEQRGRGGGMDPGQGVGACPGGAAGGGEPRRAALAAGGHRRGAGRVRAGQHVRARPRGTVGQRQARAAAQASGRRGGRGGGVRAGRRVRAPRRGAVGRAQPPAAPQPGERAGRGAADRAADSSGGPRVRQARLPQPGRVGASSGGAGGRRRAGVPRGGPVTCAVGGNGAWREELMGRSAEAGRDYWRGVLVAGGFTAIPRWSLQEATGVAEHEATVPDDLAAALRRLADELAVPLSSVLLAAHAKVLAALSGEREVVTGYVAGAAGRPLPCRLTTEPGSWRAVLLGTHQAESQLLSHQDVPVDGLRRELGLTGPLFETVFDPGDDGGELAEDDVLWVGTSGDGGRLRLRFRTEVLDADCAARIAGYHLTALALLAADPDAEHRRQSLLSAEELQLQLEGLAGPRRELPDATVHELFEQRVEAHPDAVAAEHAGRRWTYRELKARSNQLGPGLLARGLGREDVVAVVTERNLDWMAAVLAIFKAGGVYLPIEPQFPAGRIAKALARAECRL